MKIFDPHIHMTSRTTDDYEAMAAAGIVAHRRAGLLARPAAHARRQLRRLLQQSLLGWERFRAIAVRHPALLHDRPQPEGSEQPEARRRRAGAAAALSREGRRRRRRRDRLRRSDRRRGDVLRAAARARARIRPAGPDPHAASRQEARHRSARSTLVRDAGFPEERVLIDHNNEETLPIVLDDRVLGRPLDLSEHQDGRARAWRRW